MEELLKQIKSITNDELTRANSHFPLFSSAHEAYAVIKEEAEEFENDADATANYLEDFWKSVKQNHIYSYENILCLLYESAIHQAAESVQVAALALKAFKSLDSIKSKETGAEVDNGK